jgi:hypothetical protein
VPDKPRKVPAQRGFSVSYQGKTLLSRIDPVSQGERLAKAAPKTERTLYLCPSPLCGYGLESLLAAMPSCSAALCVEAEPALAALTAEALSGLLANYPHSIVFAGYADPERVCAVIRGHWGSRSFRRVEVLRLSGGWRLHAPAYDALAQAIGRNLATDWGNAVTLTRLGRRYIWNALRNLRLLPLASPLKDLDYGDAPVLVLGAGPSLDRALSGLGEVLSCPRRLCKIICVDTALLSLSDRNVPPDLVVALESQHWNLADFVGAGFDPPPRLAMDLSALPGTWDALGSETYLFATPWTSLRFFGRLKAAGLLPETVPPLGSVGLTAAALALRLSKGPVITAGIDFSYTLEAFHARSAPGSRRLFREQTRFKTLLQGDAAFAPGASAAVSKTGVPVRTNPALKAYRDLFERHFSGEGRIRDLAGSGLPLGAQVVSLYEAAAILRGGGGARIAGQGAARPRRLAGNRPLQEAVEDFIRRERDGLMALRDMLTGAAGGPAAAAALEELLDASDYLWAHFPECAGAEGWRPPVSDRSFLNRVRAELDPLIHLLAPPPCAPEGGFTCFSR